MNKIFFNGYYGYSNTGDNAFIEVAAWGAKKHWKVENVFFHMPNHGVSPTIQSKATFYKDLHIKGSYGIQKAYHLHTSKYFVSAGGSIFSGIINKNNIKAEIQKLNRKKVNGAVGVSIGPFKNNKDETSIKSYLQTLDFLAVRDKRSFELCKELDLPYRPILAADLAALLPKIYTNKLTATPNDNIKRVGISYCKYESYICGGNIKNEQERETQLIQLLNRLLMEATIELNFIIFNNHPTFGDYGPTTELISKLDPIHKNQLKITPYNSSVKSTWDNINHFNLMVCTRLHAAIFSCFSKVPFVLFEYHPKCSDFADDIGMHTRYRITNDSFDIKGSTAAILNILFNNEYIAPSNLEVAEAMALLNFESTKPFFN